MKSKNAPELFQICWRWCHGLSGSLRRRFLQRIFAGKKGFLSIPTTTGDDKEYRLIPD